MHALKMLSQNGNDFVSTALPYEVIYYIGSQRLKLQVAGHFSIMSHLISSFRYHRYSASILCRRCHDLDLIEGDIERS